MLHFPLMLKGQNKNGNVKDNIIMTFSHTVDSKLIKRQFNKGKAKREKCIHAKQQKE